MLKPQKITPCLWFDDQAELAAERYMGIFPQSRITQVSRYGEAGREHHGKPPGSVMLVAFELAGQGFTALNGGPLFTFNEAISFQIDCETQEELDHYWDALSDGGDPTAQRCGWLKDRFGACWQIIPNLLPRLLSDADPEKGRRTFEAMCQMTKLDFVALTAAHAGKGP